jgi:hypothetical protein
MTRYDMYRRFRAHQMNVATDGRGMVTRYPSGRTEVSYASAAYGEHALAAWQQARAHTYFVGQMQRRFDAA